MARRYVERESVNRSLSTALENSSLEVLRWSRTRKGILAPHSWKASYAGNCRSPVHVFRDGVSLTKSPKSPRVYGVSTERPQLAELEVRCRTCEPCLAARAAHWRLRAQAEYRAASRTWFGTLTLSPEQHFRVLSQARMAASRNGDDFDTFQTEAQFLARHRIISKMLTDYVKRVRFESGALLRFLCVAEAHKTGLPHYHMLVHEVTPADVVRHKTLKSQWRLGFSNWKLVETSQAAGYVCKYLSKSNLARVRASLDYGNPETPSGIAARRETPSTPPQTNNTAQAVSSFVVTTLGKVENNVSG